MKLGKSKGVLDLMKNRKAQFFIITVVLVAGSLSITMNVLEDYQDIKYDETSSSVAVPQFHSLSKSFDELWYSEEWRFRRGVSANPVGGVELDRFPISVSLNTSELIDDGKMLEDCRDLRVGREGRQIPYQIEEGTCDSSTEETKIWFLFSTEEEHYLYYGNNDSETPQYDTDLEWNPEEKVLENSLVRVEAGTTDGEKGFLELRRKGSRNLVPEGRVLARASPAEELTAVEEGSIYTTIQFGSGDRYQLFASNAFVRRNERTELWNSYPLWYASNATVMSHWEAGNSSNEKEINKDGDSWSGKLKEGDPPYIAAKTPGEEFLAMTTNTSGLDVDIDEYSALAESTDSGSDRNFSFGLNSTEGPAEVPYLDFLVGRGEISRSEIRVHSQSLNIRTSSEEDEGFELSDQWSTKKRISVEEKSGSYLPNHPINISLNLGDMDVREDCRNLIVVEDDVVRPHVVKEQCDSRDYSEPDDFTARFPFDRGLGDALNSSDGVFSGNITDGTEWGAGRFDSGLSFSREDYAFIKNNPRIELKGDPFSISLWLKADFDSQDYSQTVGLVEYPQSSPSIELRENSEGIIVEGRFRNDTGGLNTVNGSTDLSSLDPGWHHLALIYNQDGSNMSIFLDGEKDGAEDIEGNLSREDDTIEIGNGFEGSIDEVKFYKDRLRHDEIRDQYVTSTNITFLANLSSGDVDSDISIYGGGPAGLSGDSSETFSEMKGRSVDSKERPDIESISKPLKYEEIATDVKNRFEESSDIGNSVEIDTGRGCSTITFDNGRFALEDRVC